MQIRDFRILSLTLQNFLECCVVQMDFDRLLLLVFGNSLLLYRLVDENTILNTFEVSLEPLPLLVDGAALNHELNDVQLLQVLTHE